MSNAEIIVYCGIALTLAIGCLGELKVWIIAHDAKRRSFADVVGSMPNVGEDADFAREQSVERD